MRTMKVLAGTALLAALVLTGCSAGGGGAETGSNSGGTATGGTTATTPAEGGSDTGASEADGGDVDVKLPSECPELKEGATFAAKMASTCGMPAMEAAVGYASTSDMLGMKTETKINPGAGDLEMKSDMGEVVVLGGKTWVKVPGGTWQTGDATSSDPIIAGLSTAGDALENLNPAKMAETIAGDLTITGTDKRLGLDVFVASGKLESSGTSIEVTYYLTKNWVPLETKLVSKAGDQEMPITIVVTEWNKKQDIVAPM